LEEQVRGFGFEGDVADLVDDEQWDASEAAELVVEAALGVSVAEAGDPFRGGGERDAVAGLAGADGDPDREVGLAGAGRAEEHDVGSFGDEVEGAEVRDDIAFEGTLEGEVEVLECLAGGEPRGADASFTAVVLAGGDFTFETRGEELLMRPGLGPGPFREPFDRSGKRRRLERATEVGDVGGRVRLGDHHATPSARS